VTHTTLLVDGDILAYRWAAMAQTAINFGDHIVVDVDDIEDVQQDISDELRGLAVELEADRVIVCVSDDLHNFRKDILPSYKGNRKYAGRPELLYPLKDWLNRAFGRYRRTALEADDVMGILATHPTLIPGRKIICSIDKDMRQIPGELYDGNDLYTITKEEGDRWHLMQTLTGDPVDNYKGCPGIGSVKARRILDRWDFFTGGDPNPWRAIVAAYKARGLTEDYALVQARVARICRHTDYDFTAKKVRLWTPHETTSAAS